jgi:hypothetical protein
MNALPAIVIAGMLIGADVSGHRDVIFPEGGALAFGIGVLRNPDWSASRWRIVALPSLCAVIGHFLTQMPGPTWAAEICAVSAALLALQALGSRVAPALSAAVLPVVFGVRTWMYPVVVLAICLMIVAVVALSARLGAGARDAGADSSWQWDVVLGGWLLICTWILIAGPALSLPVAAVAPPLFVSAFEFSARNDRTLARGLRRWLLVVGAALAGSLTFKLAPDTAIAGLAGVGATVLLMRVLATQHAPALAISLIPWITGPIGPWKFTAGIAVGAGALYAGGDLIARARAELRGQPMTTARETRATPALYSALGRKRTARRGTLDLDQIGETR